jgi:hypothetical protein
MIPTNTTCDIYRAGSAPPAAPSVAGVRCHLTPAYAQGQALVSASYLYTHVLLVNADVDVRDGYDNNTFGAGLDSVYVPDQNGTRFYVVFVERADRGTSGDHKRVFLRRGTPGWPSNDV